jgi:hypothetical protein
MRAQKTQTDRGQARCLTPYLTAVADRPGRFALMMGYDHNRNTATLLRTANGYGEELAGATSRGR